MPDVTVGFKIFGDATQFEKAVSRAYDATDKLDKRSKALGKIGQFASAAAGGFGIVKVFSDAINKAQELRDKSVANGTALNDNVAALARYGDTLDSLKAQAVEAGASVLGFLSKTGEKIGSFFRGETDVDEVKAAEKLSEARAKYSETQQKATKQIIDLKKKAALEEANNDDKINLLFKENLELHRKSDALAETDERREEYRIQIAQNNLAIRKATSEIEKKRIEDAKKLGELQEQQAEKQRQHAEAMAAAQKKLNNAQNSLAQAKHDASSSTLDELANLPTFGAGVSIEAGEAGKKAREIKDLEAKKKAAQKSGDVDGARKLQDQIVERKKGLKDYLPSSETDPFGSQEQAITDAQEELSKTASKEEKPVNRSRFTGSALTSPMADQVTATFAGSVSISPQGSGQIGGGNTPGGAGQGLGAVVSELQEIKRTLKGKFLAQP